MLLVRRYRQKPFAWTVPQAITVHVYSTGFLDDQRERNYLKRWCNNKKVMSESSHKFVGDLTMMINGFSKTPFSRQNKSPDKTSLTSRDTWKESENPSVTKTYSVAFTHGVELLHNKSNGSSLSKDTLCKKSQAIWLCNQILGPKLKNQPVKLLEMTESIYYFKGSLLILLGKPTHNAYLTLGIPFGMPRSTWPQTYVWTESNWCT